MIHPKVKMKVLKDVIHHLHTMSPEDEMEESPEHEASESPGMEALEQGMHDGMPPMQKDSDEPTDMPESLPKPPAPKMHGLGEHPHKAEASGGAKPEVGVHPSSGVASTSENRQPVSGKMAGVEHREKKKKSFRDFATYGYED